MSTCYRILHVPTGLFYGRLPPAGYAHRQEPRNNFTANGDVYFFPPKGLLNGLIRQGYTIHDGQRMDLREGELKIVKYKLVETKD